MFNKDQMDPSARASIDQIKAVILKGERAVVEMAYRQAHSGKSSTYQLYFMMALREMIDDETLPSLFFYRAANTERSLSTTRISQIVADGLTEAYKVTPEECAAPETIRTLNHERMTKLRKNIPSERRKHW